MLISAWLNSGNDLLAQSKTCDGQTDGSTDDVVVLARFFFLVHWVFRWTCCNLNIRSCQPAWRWRQKFFYIMVKDNVSVVLPAGDRSPRDNGRDGRTDKISIQAQHVTCPTFFPLFYMRKRNNRLGVNCNCNSKKLPALTDLQMQNTGTASFFF